MDTKREHRTHAEGSPRGNPYDLTYSPSGRLIGKFRDNNSVTLSASVDMAYGYCDENQPHAVRRIFDDDSHQLFDLRWDEAGNLGQVSMSKPGEMFEAGRFLFWTEDCCGPRPCGANRMHTAVDDKHYSYYAYDYGGERRLKLVGVNSSVDVNAEYMTAVSTLNEPTLYPSAYMVLTNRGYTNVAKAESRASLLALPRRSSVTVRKHYYAGTERVAARLGGGGLDALYHAIGNNNTIQTKANLLFDQSLEQVNHRVLHENDLDCIMHNDFAKEEFGHWIDGIPYQMQAGVELNHDQFRDLMNSMLSDLSQGDEPDVYFYHSDLCKSREQSQAGLSYAETQQSVRSKHLGSASWITDSRGMAVQHIQYLPYGEPYINQHPFGYSERFTFTGKDPRKGWRIPLNEIKYNEQRDEETGYGYFGARYMDHELMTMWLSVDPMADKYPSISPYAYCAWNPVKLVDPDGNEIGDYYSESGKYLGSDGIEDGKIYVAFGNDKEIQEKNINGDYSFDKQYLLNRDALGEMYDYAVESNNGNNRREYGGSIYQDADGNQRVYFCKPGPEYSSGDHFSSVGKHDWIEDYDFDGLTLVTDFHTHHRYLYQTPSETDRNNVLNASGERYGGATCPYNIELAMGSKQLYFYDSKRSDVVQWSFATVERILRRK